MSRTSLSTTTSIGILLFLATAPCMAQRQRETQSSPRPERAQRRQQRETRRTIPPAVVATLDRPLPRHKDAIWCATFQMAWDEFKSDINEPIQVVGAEDLANALNNATFPRTDLKEESFYTAFGLVQDGILEEINDNLLQRFGTTSQFSSENIRRIANYAPVFVAYSFLKVDVPSTTYNRR